jgi:cell division protein ZapA (FtsZ GTPase activity inhibitor)
MAKDEKKTISVNDKEYNVDDLTPEQVAMVNHITDLDRKLGSARFNVDQLAFGREAFVNALAQSLEGTPENAQEVAAE